LKVKSMPSRDPAADLELELVGDAAGFDVGDAYHGLRGLRVRTSRPERWRRAGGVAGGRGEGVVPENSL